MPWWQVGLEVVKAAAAVAVPVIVAILGYRLNRRAKLWEASQWRNQELIRMRVEYYHSLAPQLNDLMCYFTFIGKWKQFSPPEVVAIKRAVDREFYSALPLFTPECETAYDRFIQTCFSTFGDWGEDAQLRTGFVRRRNIAPESWDRTWERMFTHDEGQQVTEEEIREVRATYSSVLGALAREIELLAPRDRYATEKFTPEAG
jgi:hypothetical protein